MITAIDRSEVQRLLRKDNAQLVEVLPRPEYEWAHLPGAVHLHLKDLNAETAAKLDRHRPVIAYCSNTECDMSPRAACRLGRLGFPRVYDYVAGKMDWLSYGLPHEGAAVLAGDLVHRDIPTCHVHERLADVRATVADGPWHVCVVLDDDVVQGVVQVQALEGPSGATVEEVMRFGITTVRPSEDAAVLAERMRHAHVNAILVTRSDAHLLGLLLRADVEAALQRR
jgi:rhodanese-related sulfurtransferase/CBS domain-containing protein